MPNLGYHAVYEHDYAAAIKSASKYGFQYVQFDLNVPNFYLDRLSRGELKSIKSMAADLGVGISFHAPGDNVGLFIDYPLIRKGLLDHIRNVLRQANRLGAHHLTVHPLNPPSFRRADSLKDGFQPENQDYFKQILKENLTQLTEVAGEVQIVVENCHLGRIANAALTEMFLEGTDIFLALDWPKMHTAGLVLDENQYTFYLKHKHRILELHLHDVDVNGRSHLAPGQGALEFETLFSQFYDQSQWLTIEVRPVIEAAKAKGTVLELIEKTGGT